MERNIRTLINTIWLHGDKKLLNEIFNFELSQKPRNGALYRRAGKLYIAVRGIGEEMTGSACQRQAT
ncbi:MAG: sporulation initiation factor Spo0A C-terminal domain-containing protein [Enterocloster sp.]